MASKSEISFIRSLHQKKYREQHGLFIVEGTKMLNELLSSEFNLYAIYALDTYLPSLQISVKLPENVNIAAVTGAELQKMSTQRAPNKVLAVVRLPRNAAEAPWDAGAGQRETGIGKPEAPAGAGRPEVKAGTGPPGAGTGGGMWLALDTLQDPGNMGTIIRLADWFGMEGILASEDSVEFYNPKVVQATMGSLFRVQLRQGDLAAAFARTKLPVYGALLEGKSIYEESFGSPGVLLLGNESKGISPALVKYISRPVTIPRFGKAESLNVATAAAVICSEIRRRSG